MIVETVRSAFPASLPRLLGVAVCSVFARRRDPGSFLYPQPLLSVASHSISAAVSVLTGGRFIRCR
ncbi:MAG: hypothetical protein ABSA93_25070 [Streptosporangiaceae bacterium]|jgi:hypothetical protein